MKIMVAVKRVADANVSIRVKPDGTGVDLANVKMSMNPFDEIAVEEAIRLREAGKATEIVVVSIGPEAAQETIRSALAMGADRGVLLTSDRKVEPLSVAKALAAVARLESPDLILLGKQAIDDDSNQTAQMLSALLDWGQATFASKITVLDGSVEVEREVDAGLQVLETRLPAIVSVDLRLNQPRYASLPNVMKAKKKPIEIKALSELGIDDTPRLTVLSVEAPASRKAGVMLNNVDELVSTLKTAAGLL